MFQGSDYTDSTARFGLSCKIEWDAAPSTSAAAIQRTIYHSCLAKTTTCYENEKKNAEEEG